MFFGTLYGATITANYKTLGGSFNNPEIDDDYLTLTGSIGSIFNAASRILAGILYDYLGLRVLFGIVLVS